MSGCGAWPVGLRRILAATPSPSPHAPLPSASPRSPERGPLVVQLTASAAKSACGRELDATGFAYRREYVLTVAHAVAGNRGPITVRAEHRRLSGTVVLFDPSRDLAILHVPRLAAPTARFATIAPGEKAVIAGFPRNSLELSQARIVRRIRARGFDIYGQRSSAREVYMLRANVRPGMSGGPLMRPDGTVAGMVFAGAFDDPGGGYALTSVELRRAVGVAARSTVSVSAQACDSP